MACGIQEADSDETRARGITAEDGESIIAQEVLNRTGRLEMSLVCAKSSLTPANGELLRESLARPRRTAPH